MLLEKKYWNKLLNADGADFVISEGEYVNAENVRFGSTDFAEGAVGYFESIGSTELIPNDLFPGENICLGSTYDPVGNRILFFNWRFFDEDGGNGIYCYDITNNIIRPVLLATETAALLFNRETCIHSCFVVNGNLYWVENTSNEPLRLQIDAGIKMYDPSYPSEAVPYVAQIAKEVVSWIRRPPGLPPILTKTTQTVPVLDANFIKNVAFFAQYRYVYRTFEESTLSSMSILSNYNREADTYNKAVITIPFAEEISQDVLQVDLVIRNVDGTATIMKSWNKNNPTDAAEIIAHNSNVTPLTYDFYNDKTGIALNSAYINKPFDSVPIYAETCATAKNRNFLANYVAGYDTPISSSLSATGNSGTPTDRLFKSDAAYQLSITFYDNYQRKCGYLAPAGAKVTTPDRIFGTFTPPDYILSIDWLLSNSNAEAEIPDWAYYYSINVTRCLRTRFFLQLRGRTSTYVRKDENGAYVFGNDEYSADMAGCAFDISTLNTFGMGYVYAEGDILKYYRNSDLNFSLSIIGQQGNYVITELQNLGTLNALVGFMFEIYTPYKPLAEEPAYEVTEIFSINSPTNINRQYSTLSGVIDGDVYIMERTDANKAFYVINTVPEARNDDQDATLGVIAAGVIEADPDFSTGNSIFSNTVGFDVATNTDRVIFENNTLFDMTIYISGNVQLRPDSDRIWRMYVVTNLNQQTILVPDTSMTSEVIRNITFNQTVTLTAGQRLFILHHQSVANSMYFYQLNLTIIVPSSTIEYDAEAMSPSDKFYKNWNFPDTGRPNFLDNIGQTVRTGSVAWSNTFIAGTKSNGLSSFDALDTKDLPLECGPCRKLQPTAKIAEQGTVMLAICENETASLYLSEVQLVGASSNAFVAQSDNVIGTINILKGNFGTVNPESVKEHRGNVFWYDLRNGSYIQYSSNGLFPVSRYLTQKFWRLFSEQYAALSHAEIEAMGSRPFVFTGIDMHNDELLVSVPKVGAPPRGYLPDYPSMIYPFDICDFRAKSLVYRLNVEPNRWQGSYDIAAENYCNGQDELYSWKNGQMYRHNADGFGTFYGVNYKSRVMLVANQVPGEPKLYFNTHISANMAPTFTYFRSELPYVQASDLADYDYQEKEGLFYSPIYRNKLIPSATGFTTDGLLTAEPVRTDALRALYEWTVSNTPLQLKFISLGYTMSRGHLK